MNGIIILFAIAGALFVYALFFERDPDKLDRSGKPLKRKKLF